MSDPLRAFFAMPLPEPARDVVLGALDALATALPGAARWTAPENLHLTLKFLGDVPPDQVPRLLQRTAAKLAVTPPFEVELAGFGAYPNTREARVLWLGVSRGQRALAQLARRIDQAAKVIGVPREKRPFQAHLTLGRLRTPQHIAIERLVPPIPIAFPVEEVVLFQSDLSSDGARHSPLATLPLRDGDAAGPDDVYDFAPEI